MSQITRILRDGETFKFSIHDDGDMSHFDRYAEQIGKQSRASEYTIQTAYSDRDEHHPGEVVAELTFTPNR